MSYLVKRLKVYYGLNLQFKIYTLSAKKRISNQKQKK